MFPGMHRNRIAAVYSPDVITSVMIYTIKNVFIHRVCVTFVDVYLKVRVWLSSGAKLV